VSKKVVKGVKAPKKEKLINLKVSESEFEEIKDRADKYADGNVSAWLRVSGKKFTPRKRDLVSL